MKLDAVKKQAYEKPVLRVLDLAADEVLAQGCKAKTQPAIGRPTCGARPCAGKGS